MSGQFISKERRAAIEARSRYLLMELWNNRHQIWSANTPENPMEVVNPGAALEYLGYKVGAGDLGQEFIDGRLSKVAGLVDFENRSVCIALGISREEQFFTAAHELGHVLLHKNQRGLHRDRPVKGPSARKDIKEVEADYFASCFLMPERRVRKHFREKFSADEFSLSEATAFALGGVGIDAIRSRLRAQRDLSRMLAECVRYNGVDSPSLKFSFEVSTEAMAIRLEELELICWG